MSTTGPLGQRAEAVARLLGPHFRRAQELGLLGPAPVTTQVWRSLAFAAVAAQPPQHLAIDLGSGAGLPGLVLASVWPQAKWLLVDSNQRRARWLEGTITALGWSARVSAVCERAEILGRGHLRAQADLVTARGFGPPGATAECAAPFLMAGGHLLVADPPASTVAASCRWPEEGLARLGLKWQATQVVATQAGPTTITSVIALALCPDGYPRRNGAPAKRPLF